jgi:hypothetical protein
VRACAGTRWCARAQGRGSGSAARRVGVAPLARSGTTWPRAPGGDWPRVRVSVRVWVRVPQRPCESTSLGPRAVVGRWEPRVRHDDLQEPLGLSVGRARAGQVQGAEQLLRGAGGRVDAVPGRCPPPTAVAAPNSGVTGTSATVLSACVRACVRACVPARLPVRLFACLHSRPFVRPSVRLLSAVP